MAPDSVTPTVIPATAPTIVRLADYKPPSFLVPNVDLDFDVRSANDVRVTATTHFKRNPAADRNAPLELLGEDLKLTSIKLDGRALTEHADYSIRDGKLVIPNTPDQFTLEVVTQLDPKANASGSGLYTDNDGTLLTQCESSGFRRITWYPDRPDVMAKFSSTITADPKALPVMLSNGNITSDQILADGRRKVKYVDPFAKPSYLFALVVADLDCIKDTFTTMSGRTVDLAIYVPKTKADQAGYAMESVKRSMAWDEKAFGREYDMDSFTIVATDFFNFGAMENKSLNIFNSKLVLSRPDLATDGEMMRIEGVIGHEYFHNWSGDRVTCRDWFQLTLKEGLTVFRDQEFSSDMNSRTIKRIGDVKTMRSAQFASDAGSKAHPIRPETYAAIDNLYTSTIYEKGAEVIRMLETLVGGHDNFRKGTDLYFQRHDGQAVTCEDFVAAIVDANQPVKFDVNQFKLWYSQAGTPAIEASSSYDDATGTWKLKLKQTVPPTPGQPVKKPMLIPVRLGLLDSQGKDMPIGPNGETSVVLQLTKDVQEFEFKGLKEKPVPSLLRNFSAPVKLTYDYTNTELAFLMANDSDGVNRWDAGQRLATKAILAGVTQNRPATLSPDYKALKAAMLKTLADPKIDPMFKATMLNLPGSSTLGPEMTVVDYKLLNSVRTALRRDFALAAKDDLLKLYETLNKDAPLDISSTAMARRALKNTALGYLAELKDPEIEPLIYMQAIRPAGTTTMTDVMAGLSLLADRQGVARDMVFDSFLATWKNETGPVNNWFSLQAGADRADSLDQVKKLMQHPLFDMKNPNSVRAVVGAFAGNPVAYHAKDGSGYRFMADQVMAIDAFNPILASRLAENLLPVPNLAPEQKALMVGQLERVAAANPSSNVGEIVHKGLESFGPKRPPAAPHAPGPKPK